MSILDDLVAKHCPKGAPVVRFADVLKKTRNINWKLSSGQSFNYIDLSSVDRVKKIILD